MSNNLKNRNTVAIIFDFDDTLTPDSTSGLLAELGVDVELFWKEVSILLKENWDPVPAYLFKLLELSKLNHKTRITKDLLENWGKDLSFYGGALSLYRRLEKHAKEIFPEAVLEFYIVSSGIGEVVRASKFAKACKEIWACDFHYDKNGEIVFPKNIVSFTDKTRYLFQIAKGIILNDSTGKPFAVNRAVPNSELRIPFEHMIYVGDGYTDIPCFSLVRKQGGIAFGVYDPKHRERWSRAWGYLEDNRVSNLAPTDYGQNAALYHNLVMAIEKIVGNMKLKKISYQG